MTFFHGRLRLFGKAISIRIDDKKPTVKIDTMHISLSCNIGSNTCEKKEISSIGETDQKNIERLSIS